jgi:hypothetical protein
MIEAGETARLIQEGLRSSLKKKIEILRDTISDLKKSGKQIPPSILAQKIKFEGELRKLIK